MTRRRRGAETRVTAAVREAIEASGLTLRAFAAKIGVSPAYLSDVARGQRPLSYPMAEKLSLQKPRRDVRDWRLLQIDDELDQLRRLRRSMAGDGQL